MPPRFFVPDLNHQAGTIRLPPAEAHHLQKVLRLRTGEIVNVFDGKGVEWRARVASAGRTGVDVALIERVETRSPMVELTIVQAVLRGEYMDHVVRDATMIGVAALQPVLTARTAVKASAMPQALERWRRIALSSAKQCGTARLPVIEPVISLEDWLARQHAQPSFVLVEPSAEPANTTRIRQLAFTPAAPHAVLAVGPEGGWTPAERDALIRGGLTPLSLGRMTLRAETVPFAAAAALLAVWDDRTPAD